MCLNGSLWTISRFYGHRAVLGYVVSSVPEEFHHRSWVLDIETTPDGAIVLIDILAGRVGEWITTGRTVASMLVAVQRLRTLPSIRVRQYYDTYKECADSIPDLPYECDGVMAICRDSMTCLKLKSARSVELITSTSVEQNRMELSTSDDVCLYTCEKGMLPDKHVVEVRVTVGHEDDAVEVTGVTLRPDKVRANPLKDVARILSVDNIALQAGRMWEKGITDKCFAVREFVYGLIIASSSNRRILMDVGCGRGQSYNMMLEKSQFGIYILVELDKECIALLMRLAKGVLCETEEVVRDVREIGNLDAALIIISMRLEDLQIEHMKSLVLRRVGLITCSFSINYVIEVLSEALQTSQVPIIGCCYLYDAVDETGTLVNKGSISMRLCEDDNSKALVKWGNSEYIEPALNSDRLSKGGSFLSIPCLESGEVVEHIYLVLQ
jgi:hypothetical protein